MPTPSTLCVHLLFELILIVHFSDSSILPEDLATQSVRLKEEQLRREEEKVRSPKTRVVESAD